MSLKRIFTSGERAVFNIAEDVSERLGVEALAKVRVADVLEITNSGISNQAYSYALKAHFDVLIIQDNLPVMAIEFDGAGHDPKNDHLKNNLCDRFGLPLVRVDMSHVNSKNFEDSAVHFFIYQLFGVDEFLKKYRNDPNESYDPMFYAQFKGKAGSFPFAYASKWRARLKKPFREHLELFDDSLRSRYEHGLVEPGTEGAYVRGNDIRAFCGQQISENEFVIGTEQLSLQVFGLSDDRYYCFIRAWTFVIGLAASEMYENALALLSGDRNKLITRAEFADMLGDWKSSDYQLCIGLDLP